MAYINNLGQVRIGVRGWVAAQSGASVTDSDATAFVTAAGITDSTQISALNTLVTDLKTYGLWTKMKALYPFVGGSADSHKWNLKDPRDLDAAFRLAFNGGGTHNNYGYVGNSTNGYANTFLIPSTNLSTTSIHISYYSQTDTVGANKTEIGSAATSRVPVQLYVRYSSTTGIGYLFQPSAGSFTVSTGKRYTIVSRTTNTSVLVMNNNSSTTLSQTVSGIAPTNSPLYINALSANNAPSSGSYSDKTSSFVTIGDGLTEVECSNLYISVQKFQTTLGRHVGTPYVSDPDAIAFLMAAGITDGTQAAAINTLVIRMKADGVWTKMKAIYPFVGGTAFSHKFNLKDPRDLDAAFRLVFNGGGTHGPNGYLGNGSNSYARTYMVHNTLQQNNTHVSFYNRYNSTNYFNNFIGCIDYPGNMSGIGIYPLNQNTFIMLVNSIESVGPHANTGHTSINKFWMINRNNSTQEKVFINGSLKVTFSKSSQLGTSKEIYLGNINGYGNAGINEASFVSIGDGLTDTEAANLYTAVQAYQTTLGRQTDVPLVSDTDAQAFLNAANITSFQQASAVNKLVVDLKAAGVWTKMKAIYPFVGGSAASHKFNLKDPRDLDAAFRLAFNGGWTHASTGAKPNGSNGWANTYFNPSLNLTTSNGHHSAYLRTILPITRQASYGCDSDWNTGGMILYPYVFNIGWISDLYDHSQSRITSNVGDSTGFVIGTRVSSNSHKMFRNGVQIAGTTYSTNGILPNANYYLGAYNWSGSTAWYDSNEMAFYSLGNGLSDEESLAFQTAVQTYQTSLGRHVAIPVYNNGLVLNLDAGNANSYPGTGTTWFDLASGNNGTLVNGPTYDVNNNGSLSFSTNKYVTIPTGDSFNLGTSDFTIEGWVYFNSISTNQVFVSKFTTWISNLDFVFRFNFATPRITFLGGDSAGISLQNSYNLVANTWYNYCVSRVSGVTTLYLNGVAQSSHTGSVNIPNDKTDIRLGYAHDNTEPLNGRMSNLRVYNRGLSATEILNNFNSTRGRFGL